MHLKLWFITFLFHGARTGFSFQEQLGNPEGEGADKKSFGDPSVPVDGNWGEWSQWGACSKTCGGGEHSRIRQCNNPAPANGGKQCEGAFRQRERLCNEQKCPVDGMWGSWTAWTACSKTCGNGTQERKRLCNNPKPAYNGTSCLGIGFQKRRCHAYSPCPIDGMWGSWTAWTACSKTCGNGTQERKRLCNNPKPAYNGTSCLGIGYQKRRCRAYSPCPIDGMWGLWSAWTACSKTCGYGVRKRTRRCDDPKPAHNGTYCLGVGYQKRRCYAYYPCAIPRFCPKYLRRKCFKIRYGKKRRYICRCVRPYYWDAMENNNHITDETDDTAEDTANNLNADGVNTDKESFGGQGVPGSK